MLIGYNHIYLHIKFQYHLIMMKDLHKIHKLIDVSNQFLIT